MINDEVTKFMALAPLMLPNLINRPSDDDTEIADEYAILYFPLEERLPIGVIMDTCDRDMELQLLYFGKSQSQPGVQHCSMFTSPVGSNHMFKLNIVSDKSGFVDGITATIYNSLDEMELGLEEDLKAHAATFDFVQAMTTGDVLALFCKL